MNFLASLDDTVGHLVHPGVRDRPLDFATHKSFLITRFGLSFVALALVPLCWAVGEAPAAWQAGVLAWLAVPCAAALAVSRSGDLRRGEALSLAVWIGLAVTVTLGTGSAIGMVFLLMVPLEAAASLEAAPVVGAVGAAAAAAILLAARSHLGFRDDAALQLTILGYSVLGAALAYACALAIVAGRIARMRLGHEVKSRQSYAALADMLDDVVLSFERSGVVCQATAASLRLFAIENRDLMGRGFFERLQVADRPVFLKLVADVAAGQPGRTVTVRLRTGRATSSAGPAFDEPMFTWVDLAVRRPSGVAHDAAMGLAPHDVAAVGLMRDASARVAAEGVVARLRADADRINAGRDLFLANITHELRTPLNAIIGFAEILSNEALAPRDPAKQRDYAGIIHQSGLHLLAVVNSVLDASKIESGCFDIVPEAFDMGGLILACCDMLTLKARQSGIGLATDLSLPVPDLVGDKRACKQILLNLLSNALKFTPNGGQVTIGARPDGNAVLISVADTGIGIASRDLPRLGDPFFQARTGYDRPNDGTGLGLSVVRGLVGLHGGTIAIESSPGQGTRVTVRLPSDCRRSLPVTAAVAKIETISRYSSPIRHGEMPGGGRMHKIA